MHKVVSVASMSIGTPSFASLRGRFESVRLAGYTDTDR